VVDLWPYVQKTTSPTIYVLGGDSAIVPPHTRQKLKETIPKVAVLVLPRVGHYPHLETPDEFVRIVNQFLSGALSASRPPR
jgi:pimeloyl-ACP methyl ester carboxylesterase